MYNLRIMAGEDQTVRRLLSGGGKAIPLFKVFMPESVMEPLRRTLFSGFIGEGPRVEEFERELEPWCGSEQVLTVNNGTAALQLALRLAGVGPGDEVISTPMTCSATNMPVLALGAKIVWADIDPWTGNIDPASAAEKVTSKTRAIICVHWGGYPCDLDELNALAADRGVALIEDACHAFGSIYRGRPIGAHSDHVCFSFQAIKEITTVDGGALVCRSVADFERGRLLRWYGIDRRAEREDLRCEADILEYGYKFHMNDVAATIGIEQLKYVAENIRLTRSHATRYDEAFRGLANLHPLRYQADRSSAHWLYTLRVKERRGFAALMRDHGVVVSQVHARNDLHTVFRESRVALTGVDEFSSEQISIPVGWWLSEADLRRIISAVLRYDEGAKG